MKFVNLFNFWCKNKLLKIYSVQKSTKKTLTMSVYKITKVRLKSRELKEITSRLILFNPVLTGWVEKKIPQLLLENTGWYRRPCFSSGCHSPCAIRRSKTATGWKTNGRNRRWLPKAPKKFIAWRASKKDKNDPSND